MADACWKRLKELVMLMTLEKDTISNEEHLTMKQECDEIITKIDNMGADAPMTPSNALEFSQHLLSTYLRDLRVKNGEVPFKMACLSRMLKKLKNMSDKSSKTFTKKRIQVPRAGPPYRRPRGAAPKNKKWNTLTGEWVPMESIITSS